MADDENASKGSNAVALARATLTKAQDFAASETQDRQARLEALKSAKRLVLELEDPDDSMLRRIEQAYAGEVLKFILHIGVMEHIPATGGIRADDLAKAVGADKSLIVRLMRLLVAVGDFKEIDIDTYAHGNARNLTDPTRRGFHECLLEMMVERVLTRLPEYYNTRPLLSPTSRTHNPFSWASNMEGSDWTAVISHDPTMLKKFGLMIAADPNQIPATTGYYPYDTRLNALSAKCATSDRVFMVDVGGACGGDMKSIRLRYPELRGRMVVQDLEHTFAAMPAGFLPEELDIKTMAHDFFTPQPVKGAAVYHMRRVLHDWSDEFSRKILKLTADAMSDDSKILIAETVMTERVTVADSFAYWSDITMWLFAGKERSLADWKELLGSVGLEISGVWESGEGLHCIIEACKSLSSVS